MDAWKTKYTFLFGAEVANFQNKMAVSFGGRYHRLRLRKFLLTPLWPHWAWSGVTELGAFTWGLWDSPYGEHISWLHIDAAERHPKKHERNWRLPNCSVHVLLPYLTSSKRHHEGVKTGWQLSSHGHSHHRAPKKLLRRCNIKSWRQWLNCSTSCKRHRSWTKFDQAFNNPKNSATEWGGSLLVMTVPLPRRDPTVNHHGTHQRLASSNPSSVDVLICGLYSIVKSLISTCVWCIYAQGSIGYLTA